MRFNKFAMALLACSQAESAIARPVAIPLKFHGKYDAAQNLCVSGLSDMVLRISATKLRFHESVGTPIEILSQPNGEITVLAEFAGEGENWTSMAQLALSPDGKRLIVRNPADKQVAQQSTARVRCVKKK